MSAYTHLLLVVLTDAAKRRLMEFGWGEVELADELASSKGSIRLYNWRPRPDKPLTVALPIRRGAGVLLLKRAKGGENHFCCVEVERFGAPVQLSTAGNICHNLRPDARIQIAEGRDANSYLSDALDCDEIEREVGSKKAWRPHVGGGVEDRKWCAYLRLYEHTCEKRKMAGLPANIVADKAGKMTVALDLSGMDPEIDEKELEEKIRGARGELFKFNLSPLVEGEESARQSPKLGTLLNAGKVRGELRLTFKLDQNFSKSLSSEQEKILAASAEEDASENTPPPQPDSPGEDIAAADALSPQKSGEGDDADSSRLYLHADFIGDLSQIHIMRRGLYRIKGFPIWKVLTEERVAKLPGEEDAVVEFGDDCRLNDGQKEAVRKALRAEELLLIWGPPGTGKTEVIAEIARQEAARGGRTLIVSQANLAVDNAIARLHGSPGVWPLRIAKDDWVPEEDDKGKVPMQDTSGKFFLDWTREKLKKKLRDSRSEKADDGVVNLRKEFLERLSESRKDGAKISRTFPQMAALYRRRLNVVGATLMESGKTVKPQKEDGNKGKNAPELRKLSRTTGINGFSAVIVDEVSKAMPPELFLPVPLGKRLILVGDHRQLPPVIKDPVSGEDRSLEEWAKEAGVPEEELKMEPTLFERLWEKHKGDNTRDIRAMLTTQYRMHTDIERLIQPFYTDSEGKLECGLPPDELEKMSVAQNGFFAGRHVAWIHTGKGDGESKEGTSSLNQAEVGIVGDVLVALPNGREGMSVGVITFYGAQLRALCDKYDKPQFRRKFPGGLIFGTVDRFQGRECDVIICSLVRNNKDHNIGFASKPNRINVAFSRARELLCIVGSVDTFCYGPGKSRAREIYKSAYHACEKAKGCISESELKGSFGLDDLKRKWGGHAR